MGAGDPGPDFRLADRALLQAKRAGRNRAVKLTADDAGASEVVMRSTS